MDNPYRAPTAERLPRSATQLLWKAAILTSMLSASSVALGSYGVLIPGVALSIGLSVVGHRLEQSSAPRLAILVCAGPIGHALAGISAMGVTNYGISRLYGGWTIGFIAGMAGTLILAVGYAFAFASCRAFTIVIGLAAAGGFLASLLTGFEDVIGIQMVVSRKFVYAMTYASWQPATLCCFAAWHQFVAKRQLRQLDGGYIPR